MLEQLLLGSSHMHDRLLLSVTYNFLRCLVRVAGIEPASLSTADFKSAVFTYFTTLAIITFYAFSTYSQYRLDIFHL